MSAVRVSWADRSLTGFLSLECGGGVRAGTGLPDVGSSAREWDSRGTIGLEVLGFEERGWVE